MSKTIIDILEDLESTSGKNARIEILEVNRKNEVLKKVFIAAQDPYTVYYVSKFKMPAALKRGPDDDTAMQAFFGLLTKLSSRELTGNAAKDAVTEFFNDLDARQQKWCQRILLKNLRCGLQESSINNVWPGVVKSFSVALATTLQSEFVKGEGIKIIGKVNYPVRVEPKLDGLRCIAVKKSGKVTFFTRNGTVLESPGLAKIREVLTNASFDNVVLDGEMLANGNWNDSVSAVMKGR